MCHRPMGDQSKAVGRLVGGSPRPTLLRSSCGASVHAEAGDCNIRGEIQKLIQTMEATARQIPTTTGRVLSM